MTAEVTIQHRTVGCCQLRCRVITFEGANFSYRLNCYELFTFAKSRCRDGPELKMTNPSNAMAFTRGVVWAIAGEVGETRCRPRSGGFDETSLICINFCSIAMWHAMFGTATLIIAISAFPTSCPTVSMACESSRSHWFAIIPTCNSRCSSGKTCWKKYSLPKSFRRPVLQR